MAIWRPAANIRVKVLGLAGRQHDLLAVEIERDDGRIEGVRPPGGSIEFGETREAALVREFAEELATGIRVIGPWLALENIYEHEGAVGHEYIFAAAITLEDASLYEREAIRFNENDGVPCVARWFSLEALRQGPLELYPTGLLGLLS